MLLFNLNQILKEIDRLRYTFMTVSKKKSICIEQYKSMRQKDVKAFLCHSGPWCLTIEVSEKDGGPSTFVHPLL